MHDVLMSFLSKPHLFSAYTSPILWGDPHISKQMLSMHIDPASDRASRRLDTIVASVAWLDDIVTLSGKKVCDLGCGPGLYAERFHDCGAQVVGVDLSSTSISYARAKAGKSEKAISYRAGDYTTDPLPHGMDIFALIFCDYCALSDHQRRHLLEQMRSNLNDGGRIVFDVYSMETYSNFCEETSIEPKLMGGFWAEGDYVGLRKTFRYDAECASLERFLIVQPDRHWEIFNWLQYYSLDSLEAELRSAGFKLEHVAGSLAGDCYQEDNPLIAAIATRI